MAPTPVIDLGLEAVGHAGFLSILRDIADRARHLRCAAVAGVRAFPGPSGMLLAYPSASSQRVQVMLRPVADSFRWPQIVRVEPPIHLRSAFGISGSQFLLGPFTGRCTPSFLAVPCGLF